MVIMAPTYREVSSTRNDFDPAISGTPQFLYWATTDSWVPLIQGGADDDSGDDGDATSGGTGDGTSTDKDDGDSGNDKVFTQDQLNAIVTRETSKAARGKLDPKELGFDSAKDLKEFLEGVKAKNEEAKSEEEKAREQAIEEARTSARNEVLSVADERLRKAEFLVQAVDHGVMKEARDDAYLLAPTLEAWADVEVGEGGNVSGFDDIFFDELKKAKPFLFVKEGSSDNNIGQGSRGNGQLEPGDDDLRQKYSALRRN